MGAGYLFLTRLLLFVLLLDVLAGFAGQLFRQGFDAREVVLEVAAAHHAGGDFQADFAFRGVHGDCLKVRQERVVLLGGAQIPRTGVRVASPMTLHRSGPRYLAYSGHERNSLSEIEIRLRTGAIPDAVVGEIIGKMGAATEQNGRVNGTPTAGHAANNILYRK